MITGLAFAVVVFIALRVVRVLADEAEAALSWEADRAV